MRFFIVVGSQIPFDRLVMAIDTWAEDHNDCSFFGQIGSSKIVPKNITYFDKLNTKDFNQQFSDSDIIISHAGMGVILKAMENSKPIIVVPRQVALNECTTDHQLATARAFKELDYIHVAMDIEEMILLLNNPSGLKSKHTIREFASDQLINTLADFIQNS